MPTVRRALLVALLLIAQWVVLAPRCHAGPLVDWLNARRAYYGSTTIHPYPWATTAYAYPWAGVPARTIPSSTTAYAYPGSQTYPRVRTTFFGGLFAPWRRQAVVSYMPVTSYRTTWVRVPVTYYRPVVSVDPASGCGVTCMKPCTAYRWHVQRVPYTSYRAMYAPLACNTCNPCEAVSGTAACGSSYIDGCSSCGTSAPYYTPTTVAPAPATEPADSAPVLTPGNARLRDPDWQTRGFPSSSGTTNGSTNDSARPRVQPVPDPDADEAPQLLNPRDRTASYGSDARVMRASAAAEPEWDDSGWYSIRP